MKMKIWEKIIILSMVVFIICSITNISICARNQSNEISISVVKNVNKYTIETAWPDGGVEVIDGNMKHTITSEYLGILTRDNGNVVIQPEYQITDNSGNVLASKEISNQLKISNIPKEAMQNATHGKITYAYFYVTNGNRDNYNYDKAAGTIEVSFDLAYNSDGTVTVRNVNTIANPPSSGIDYGEYDDGNPIYPTLPTKTTNTNSDVADFGDVIDKSEDFIDRGDLQVSEGTLQKMIKTLYNIFFVIGVVAAVFVGLFIGIKIMVSSVEEKAEYKKLLGSYVIGCIILFGGFAIWRLIVNILQEVL